MALMLQGTLEIIKVRSKTQAILTALYYWLEGIILRLLLPILMSV